MIHSWSGFRRSDLGRDSVEGLGQRKKMSMCTVKTFSSSPVLPSPSCTPAPFPSRWLDTQRPQARTRKTTFLPSLPFPSPSPGPPSLSRPHLPSSPLRPNSPTSWRHHPEALNPAPLPRKLPHPSRTPPAPAPRHPCLRCNSSRKHSESPPSPPRRPSSHHSPAPRAPNPRRHPHSYCPSRSHPRLPCVRLAADGRSFCSFFGPSKGANEGGPAAGRISCG